MTIVFRKLFSLVVLLVAILSVASARRVKVAASSSSNNDNNTTTWSSWYDDLMTDYVRTPMQDITNEWETTMEHTKKNMKRRERHLKRSVEKHFFHQRFGWEWVRYAIRDHLGVVAGIATTFYSSQNPRVATGATIIMVAQLGWQASNVLVKDVPHEPWLREAIAGIIGVVSLQLPQDILNMLSPFFVALALVHSFNHVSGEFYGPRDIPKEPVVVTTVSVLAATSASLVAIYNAGVPWKLAAASMSGATLLCDSIGSEVSGNLVRFAKITLWTASWLYNILKFAIRTIWRPFWFLIKLISRVAKLVWNVVPDVIRETTKKIFVKVGSAWYKLRMKNKIIKRFFQENFIGVLLISIGNAFKRSKRAVVFPLAIATWGVAKQMGWQIGVLKIRKIAKYAMDPFQLYDVMQKLLFKLPRLVLEFLKAKFAEKEKEKNS